LDLGHYGMRQRLLIRMRATRPFQDQPKNIPSRSKKLEVSIIQTLELMILSWVLNHCAIDTGQENPTFYILYLLVPAAGFKPLILWFWVDCSTTVLLPLIKVILPFKHFISHGTKSMFQTLELTIMSWVFNHCATVTCQNNLLFNILSFLVPKAGFKPLILGLWVECSTTMPLTQAKIIQPFTFYISWCLQQDSNPWSYDFELTAQPLCYYHWSK
jgi:hypothetical protein